ncbi:MAG TPA: hypothetical protein EYH56_03905 [Nanoarchaeota archaeon]|nr:hypothetical protein [Nanoarchaeota archaeon]
MKINEYFVKFGWRRNPFTLVVSPEIFIGYKEQREAIISHVNEEQKICLISGPTGAGKTTLLLWINEYFKNSKELKTYYIPKPPKKPKEFVQLFLNIFPLNIIEKLLRKRPNLFTLPDYVRSKLKNSKLLLLIDEAHETTKDALEWLRVLVDQTNIILVIAGLPNLEYKIKEKLETFDQRITTRVFLDHLSEKETYELILKRIQWAGGNSIAPFTEQAVKEIYLKTNGFPREVLKLCDKLIHEAAKKDIEIIDGEFVKQYSEFKETKFEEIKVSFEPKPRTEIKDLPAKQRRVLEILSKHPWLTPSQIAEKLGVEKYKTHHHAIRSVNNILKRLLMEGYVQREARGKAFVYSLTPRARAYFVEA